MSNAVAIIILGILLTLTILNQFIYSSNIIFVHSQTLAQAVALIMMLSNGTFTDRKYFNLAYLLIGAAVVGWLLNILHWSGADEILIGSVAALLILYSIHFASKTAKRFLDVLKLIMVYSSAVAVVLTFTRWAGDPWVWGKAALVIFWTTFLWFLVDGIRRKQLFTEENP
jgi:hypothetical protein